jgi:hypothetical protein
VKWLGINNLGCTWEPKAHFVGSAAESVAAERLFSAAGKMHDDLKKSTSEETLEDMLTVAKNFPDA